MQAIATATCDVLAVAPAQRQRERHEEAGDAGVNAVEADVAALLPREAPGGRQSHAAAASGGSSGEEGIEQMFACGRWAVAIVFDDELQRAAMVFSKRMPRPAVRRRRFDRVTQQAAQRGTHLRRVGLQTARRVQFRQTISRTLRSWASGSSESATLNQLRDGNHCGVGALGRANCIRSVRIE